MSKNKHSKSSKSWLKEHFDDPYVQEAQKKAYRSRACFKLIELQEKDQLVKPGMTVVDLGAAPGGWSQLTREWLGAEGRLLALDILPMDSLPGVEFIQGDFSSDTVYHQLQDSLAGQTVDLVICDMAPNISGNKVVDQFQAISLCELALDFCLNHLKEGGDFVVKVFQGQGQQEFEQELKQVFAKILIRKPKSSRARSREVYYVAKSLKRQSTGRSS